MWIGGAEGTGYRYEVSAITDGYLVQMRDIETGHVEDGEARLFRTSFVALAHAQTMAAIDRFAAAALLEEETDDVLADAERCEQRFNDLRSRHADHGCSYAIDVGPAPVGRVLH